MEKIKTLEAKLEAVNLEARVFNLEKANAVRFLQGADAKAAQINAKLSKLRAEIDALKNPEKEKKK